MATKEIKTRIQLVRNFTTEIEKTNPSTLNGEFYICRVPGTNIEKFKIGDGVHKFNELPYYEDNLLESLGILIDEDSKADKQILVYNGSSGNWENEKFFDTNTLVYDRTNGLNIKGYDTAAQGQMLVKDINNGIVWVTPVDTTQLNQAVAAATAKAQESANSASASASSASESSQSAAIAAAINEQTMEWIENKFWWGTLEEYNALPEVLEGTFYFVRTE